MFYLMKSKYAIFSNIKVTKIERSAFGGRSGIGSESAAVQRVRRGGYRRREFRGCKPHLTWVWSWTTIDGAAPVYAFNMSADKIVLSGPWGRWRVGAGENDTGKYLVGVEGRREIIVAPSFLSWLTRVCDTSEQTTVFRWGP